MTRRGFLAAIAGVFGLALVPLKNVAAIVYDDEPVSVVRDSGFAFGTRKHDDSEHRWKVQSGNGTHLWGDGDEIIGAFGAHEAPISGRTFFEFNTHNYPVSLSLNSNKTGDETISLTAENGSLVIRNEYRGRDCVLAIIDYDGIHTPERE